jgi:hypothetical protein
VLLAHQSRAVQAASAAPAARAGIDEAGGRWLSLSPGGTFSLLDSQRNLQRLSANTAPGGLRLGKPGRSAASQAALPQREAHPPRSGVARPPEPVAPPDLATVLQQLVDEWNGPDRPDRPNRPDRPDRLTVRLVLEGSGHVSYARSLTLVKLAREALHNVRQHAQAHTATMTLAYAPGRVELSVRDDGVGLLDGTYERPGLHALRALHYRLAEMDGRLDVFEPHDGGLVVRGSLPLGS